MTDQVTTNLDDFLRRLDGIGRKALPRAASDSLTAIAFDGQRDLKSDASDDFDSPTSFTLRAFAVKRASFKDDPIEARVFVLPAQSGYLKFQILGGVRDRGELGVTGGGALLPVQAKINKFGNFPQGPIRYLGKAASGKLAGGETFIRRLKGGDKGLFQRPKGAKRSTGKTKLLAVFRDAIRYDPNKFNFFGIVQKRFLRDFEKTFDNKFTREVNRIK